jgi:hypothetical protein
MSGSNCNNNSPVGLLQKFPAQGLTYSGLPAVLDARARGEFPDSARRQHPSLQGSLGPLYARHALVARDERNSMPPPSRKPPPECLPPFASLIQNLSGVEGVASPPVAAYASSGPPRGQVILGSGPAATDLRAVHEPAAAASPTTGLEVLAHVAAEAEAPEPKPVVPLQPLPVDQQRFPSFHRVSHYSSPQEAIELAKSNVQTLNGLISDCRAKLMECDHVQEQEPTSHTGGVDAKKSEKKHLRLRIRGFKKSLKTYQKNIEIYARDLSQGRRFVSLKKDSLK